MRTKADKEFDKIMRKTRYVGSWTYFCTTNGPFFLLLFQTSRRRDIHLFKGKNAEITKGKEGEVERVCANVPLSQQSPVVDLLIEKSSQKGRERDGQDRSSNSKRPLEIPGSETDEGP